VVGACGEAAGAKSCLVEHVGLVVSGRATAAMDGGRVIEMKAGDVFIYCAGTRQLGRWR
jgi:uncharacterized cupin superfamily protein